MTTSSAVDRAVSEVRQAAFEISATDQRQAYLMLREALKLQPGHPDLLGDLAVLHLQAGRMDACIEAATEALACQPDHDESAYALALALEASGRLQEARVAYADLAQGRRAERFAGTQPELAAQCRAKLMQLDGAGGMSVASPRPAPAAGAQPDRKVPVQAAANDRAAEQKANTDAPRVVRPGDLGRLLRECHGIEALSLDCFDTILWRHTHRPVDVFHDMQNRPAFRAAGIDALTRQNAELHARQLQLMRTGLTEVTLDQIYLAARPDLDTHTLNWLAEDELAAEMDACHAHPEAVRLLRDARARRLPVTVVSDTYFDGQQLRRLLAHALPADAFAAIGDVICSSEHGACKSQGLFKLSRLRMPANMAALLHVGDNKDADVTAPRELGLSATLLLHDGEDSAQRRALSASAVCLLDPTARASRMLYAAYRAVHATYSKEAASPVAAIGHGGLGSLMHAFARWIDQEAERLAATHDSVKLVFLLRDAHLPLQAYRALGGRHPNYAAHISRFTAYAASFREQRHVDHYLAHFATNLTLPMIARQLLLSESTSARLLEESEADAQPRRAFLKALRKPEVMAEIKTASAAYRARLRSHLEREVDFTPGDTLMLVDLGYAGTIQRLLGPLMASEWGSQVYGRYLLAVGSVDERHQGLLDRSWLDDRALGTLQPYVGVLETLSSDDSASAVGYDDHGHPVFEQRKSAHAQQHLVTAIQAECLRFVREAEQHLRADGRPMPTQALRDEALGALGRLIFMPSEPELRQLAEFKLEINLGSGIARPLFDVEAGLDGLRRHGLFYVGLAQHRSRMTIPVELRAAGLEHSLSMLARSRFDVEVSRSAWSMRQLPVTVLVSRDGKTAELKIDAQATYDGYYSILLPLPSRPADVALALGRDHAWLQIHSATLAPVQDGRAIESQEADAMHLLVAHGVADHGGGLLNFENDASMLMFPVESYQTTGQAALRLCFRPVTSRQQADAAMAATEPHEEIEGDTAMPLNGDASGHTTEPACAASSAATAEEGCPQE